MVRPLLRRVMGYAAVRLLQAGYERVVAGHDWRAVLADVTPRAEWLLADPAAAASWVQDVAPARPAPAGFDAPA